MVTATRPRDSRPKWAERLWWWLSEDAPDPVTEAVQRHVQAALCWRYGHVKDACVDGLICSRGLDRNLLRCYRCDWHEERDRP